MTWLDVVTIGGSSVYRYGELDDAAAVATMAERFERLCQLWDRARAMVQEWNGDAA